MGGGQQNHSSAGDVDHKHQHRQSGAAEAARRVRLRFEAGENKEEHLGAAEFNSKNRHV